MSNKEKKDFHRHEFSKRLRKVMLDRGYGSCTAASGVSPTALRNAIGCFSEMALRYLDGRSIPDPDTILKIAEWLSVDPGYLLFGDVHIEDEGESDGVLRLDQELLIYALKKFASLLKKANNEAELVEFFVSILSDLSSLKIGKEERKKVFDMTLVSSHQLINFNAPVEAGSQQNGKPMARKIARKVTS